MLGALGEFERELIRQRTRAGVQPAKGRGLHVERPRKVTARQLELARELIESGREKKARDSGAFGCGREHA